VRSDAHPVALFGAWAGGADVIGSEPALVRSPPQSLADVLDSLCAADTGPAAARAGALTAPDVRERINLINLNRRTGTWLTP
jgi:hypothetical protein